ncbi:MAG: ABC transporter substrate-binding protein [Solirubrobacteraceae bacterium]
MKRRTLTTLAAITAAVLPLAACGRDLPTAAQLGGGSSGTAATAGLSPGTTPPIKDYDQPVVWATYRPVETLDPVQAFDYPENSVDTTLCDALQRQSPDGSIGPGLATATYPTPTKLVLNLRSGPTFWDGHPVTAADVVFSLKRAASPTSGSFYAVVFNRVKSIVATSPSVVTITLSKPDFWLQGELSSMPGIVVEKAYAERQGKKFGTPQGLTMCSGPYEVKKWIPGTSLTEVANPHYWDSTLQPKVHELIFKGIGDDASVTSGFETGAIQGDYPLNISTLPQLQADKNLTVSVGPSNAVDALVIDNLKGPLGNVKVRQALSMAINREALIQALYHGHAQLPRTIENPGAWGYGQSVFQADWAHLPVPTVNIARGKQLIKQAGAEGQSITIGTTSSINSLATDANSVRQAAVSIGLKATIDSVSAANYINFFTSASARKGIDTFPTTNYPDYADPAGLYNTLAIPGGSQNYDGFSDPAITSALEDARSTANPDQRAALVAKAGDLIAKQLPWIPLDAPDTLMVTAKQLTGGPDSFVYMGGPWANMIGGS